MWCDVVAQDLRGFRYLDVWIQTPYSGNSFLLSIAVSSRCLDMVTKKSEFVIRHSKVVAHGLCDCRFRYLVDQTS